MLVIGGEEVGLRTLERGWRRERRAEKLQQLAVISEGWFKCLEMVTLEKRRLGKHENS